MSLTVPVLPLQTRSMPPPSQSAGPVRWPMQPLPPGAGPGAASPAPPGWPHAPLSAGRQLAVARPTRTYSGPRPELLHHQVMTGERPPLPANLPPGAQRTHQRIMKTLTSHSSAIQQAVANGVLSLEVRPPGSAGAPPPAAPAGPAKKAADRGGRPPAPPPSRALPPIAPALNKAAAAAAAASNASASTASGASGASAAQMSTSFKIKLPSSTPRDGTSSPTSVAPAVASAPSPGTPSGIDAPPAQEADAQLDTSGAEETPPTPPPSESPGRTIAWFHKSQRLRPGNYTYVKSGDSLNGKLIPFVAPKGRPRRQREDAGPIVKLVVGTPMNRKRYPPLEKALAVVAAAARGLGTGQQPVRPGHERKVMVAPDSGGAGVPSAQTGGETASTSAENSQQQEADPKEEPSQEDGADEEKEAKTPVTPVKRGPGRPRKDGLPPGSVKSRKSKRGRPPVKRPAADSQPSTSTAPAAKRQRVERPPPENLEGRRHSRRLSARLSQPEPEPEPEQEPKQESVTEEESMQDPTGKEQTEGEAGADSRQGDSEQPGNAAMEEAPASSPAQSDSLAETGDNHTASGDGKAPDGNKVISDDAEATSDAVEAASSDSKATSGQNGETASPAEGDGTTDDSASPLSGSAKTASTAGQSEDAAPPAGAEDEHIPSPAAAT